MAVINMSGFVDAPLNATNVVDAGWYDVKIIRAEQKIARTGNPGVHFDFLIEDGNIQVETGVKPVGKHLFLDVWIPGEEGSGRNFGLMKLGKITVAAGVERTVELAEQYSNGDYSILLDRKFRYKVSRAVPKNGTDEKNDFLDAKPLAASLG